MNTSQKQNKIGWKIKTCKFGNWHFCGQVYLKNVKDRGNPLTNYRKFSSQSSQQSKPHQNWMKNKNSIYLSNMRNFRIWAPFRPPFETKQQNFFMVHQ